MERRAGHDRQARRRVGQASAAGCRSADARGRLEIAPLRVLSSRPDDIETLIRAPGPVWAGISGLPQFPRCGLSGHPGVADSLLGVAAYVVDDRLGADGDDLARFVVLDCRPDREIARKQPPVRAGPDAAAA